MKTLIFLIFITIGLLSNSNLDSNSNEIDLEASCIQIENVDFENLDGLNLESSDICDYNIWAMIWRDGELSCITGQNYPCIPCQDDDEQ